MQDLMSAALTALVAALAAATPILWRLAAALAESLRQQAAATVQSRLGDAAARAAGEIAAAIASSPDVRAATQQMVSTGANALADKFRETLEAKGIPTSTLEAMIAGELGKMGVAITR